MFGDASKDRYTEQYIPDLFVTQDKVKIWHDDNAFYNDNGLVDWYNYYKEHMGQKKERKKE